MEDRFDEMDDMREEYDLLSMKAMKNPYAKRLKKQITIKVTIGALDYFKDMAKETGIPYQTLINMYLVDCVEKNRKLEIDWK